MRVHSSALSTSIPIIGLFVFASGLADTSTTTQPAPAASSKPEPKPKLNLKVPDVNRTMTPGQRRAATGPNDTDKAEETVEVQRQRVGETAGAPKPPGGLASVFWAFAHPVDAWRIFFPLPPEQRGSNEAPRNN